MMINLMDKNYSKIILLLIISPGSSYSREEIKEKTNMNNVPLDSSLNTLLNLKILNLNKKLYSLNINSSLVQYIIKEKGKLSNLPLKIQYIIIEFINKVSKLRKISHIILFGSYSKLIFTEKSDVDIAVIFSDKTKEKNNIEKKILEYEESLSKRYKTNIQTHFFMESDLKHKEDPLIKDILRNGVDLL
jgi:predicted nucleotidyltransferase